MAASGETAEELAYLFGELADTDDHTAESLLAVLEGGSGADAERLLPLLEELPRGFVFATPAAVARMVEAGYAHGRRVGAWRAGEARMTRGCCGSAIRRASTPPRPRKVREHVRSLTSSRVPPTWPSRPNIAEARSGRESHPQPV